MVWTYIGATFSGRDYVRFLIGDTNADEPLLNDYEIDAMLVLYPSQVEAAAHLCAGLAVKFAAEGDLKVDGYDFQNIKKAEFYRARAKELLTQATGFGTATPLGGVSFGGVDKSAKDANRADTGVVQPAFYRGQFESQPLDIEE